MDPVARIFNGTYTISSPKGGHRTFDIRTIKKGSLKDKRVVSLLTGPDNTKNYTGFAFIDDNGIHLWRRFTASRDFQVYAAMLWDLGTTGESGGFYNKGYRLLSESRCLICNRKLTHPESIKTGIGPECGHRSH